MVASLPRSIRISSRKSQLALIQTHWVQGELSAAFPDRTFEVQTMSTHGDKVLDVALAKIGDKGLFTKELEDSMLNGETDFAVHSLKDLPTRLPEGLMLGCVTEREDPADALVLHEKHAGMQISDLTEGTVIGTSSLRRLAQLRHHYPHLVFKDVRGNLNTRLSKLDNGDYDALILAVAGLKRMNFGDRISQILPPEISLHAVGQGALGIECRDGDSEILSILKTLEHTPTAIRCHAERAFLRELEGGCQVPIGVNTILEGDRLTLTGLVASLDGKTVIKDTMTGSDSDAVEIGTELAKKLRSQGAQAILDVILADIQR
ncbi:MAG: hydroxymethylbilane synthase [Cyanobacteria bacterium J06633_2]